MAYDLNRVIVLGRLTRDPEMSATREGKPVCRFSIANNRGKEEADVNFFDCSAFDRSAEFVGKYLKKGSQVIVEGRLRHSRFTTKEGEARSKIEIQADNVQGVGGRSDAAPASEGGSYGSGGGGAYGERPSPPRSAPSSSRPAPRESRADYDPIPIKDLDDGDVPF